MFAITKTDAFESDIKFLFGSSVSSNKKAKGQISIEFDQVIRMSLAEVILPFLFHFSV